MIVNHRMVAVGAVVGGFVLGFLDFVWIKFVPFPFADLGNSSAVWAVAAFAFGHWVRSGWVRAALGAVVLLVIAVPSYYLAATLIQGDDIAVIGAPASLLWMFFGMLAGVVFGVAGFWARTSGWRQAVGVALPGAVLFAETAIQIRRIGDPSYGDDPMWPAVIRAVLGILVIVLAAPTTRQRTLALVTAIPLGLVGFTAFSLAGFA
ncbi:DUF6518 family protein [Micromonospora sp. NPDC050417]|uniref:DUF6518 family protein n=1 Tax=Micromonospora sp. NPDC050417 TaxID=3364280 RepID=UPI0037953555